MRSLPNNYNMSYFKRKPVLQEFSFLAKLVCFSLVFEQSRGHPLISAFTKEHSWAEKSISLV
jgi:hypothetical protein